MASSHRIAVIPGDGIGKEVVPEGLRSLEAAAAKFGIALQFDEFPWSCDYYAKHGRMMPEDWIAQIGGHDAIFFGAVGWPATVPDHVSLWGSLIQWRRHFDQYVNLRPCRLMPGIPTPLAGRRSGDIDFVVIRENTEGEYSSVGGRMFEGTDRETVFQQTVFTRKGVDRIMRFAFELALTRPAKQVTSATKSNGISITMPYWDERFKAMASKYPAIRYEHYHIHYLTANSSCIPTGSTSSSARTCSATFFPTWVRPCAARSGSRHRPTSIPSAIFHRRSSRSTARRRTSPARASPIRSGRSGRVL
jgi:tartrate dehydrogenase/decarboxylase/D-malate dehydrogenase